ncbi:MAG TPA: restriction endonuclease subunit M, partial [Marinilabiliales bacterium]|nr:restriction endonuclease subunit M [Marinilabiliales bacterium]
MKLSEYDFISEVDVNILGHIFENSLNELDELTRELAPVSKEKAPVLSRRKKDGVFYTPKYITKYIVENTVGKLCKEKKAELQFNEEDYNTGEQALKPREQAPLHRKKTKQALYDKLKTYQNWLLQLTI